MIYMPIIILILIAIPTGLSLVCFGATLTWIQLAHIAANFLCMQIAVVFLTRQWRTQRVLLIQSVLFFTLVCVELLVFHSIQLLSDPMRVLHLAQFLNSHRTAVRFGPYFVLFAFQILLTMLMLKAPVVRSLLASMVAFATASALIYIAWRFLIPASTEKQWLLYILGDLFRIYPVFPDSPLYDLLELVR